MIQSLPIQRCGRSASPMGDSGRRDGQTSGFDSDAAVSLFQGFYLFGKCISFLSRDLLKITRDVLFEHTEGFHSHIFPEAHLHFRTFLSILKSPHYVMCSATGNVESILSRFSNPFSPDQSYDQPPQLTYLPLTIHEKPMTS